jgi:hypothetical protein
MCSILIWIPRTAAAACGQPLVASFGFVGAATAINKSLMMTALPVAGVSTGTNISLSIGFNAAQVSAYSCFLSTDAPFTVGALPGTRSIEALVPSQARTMSLEWTDATNALPVTYQVFFGTASASLINVAAGVAGRSYALASLDFTKKYFWQVAAADAFGRTSTSGIYSFSIVPVTERLIAAPNPFHPGRGSTSFLFVMSGAGSADLEIFSLPDMRRVFNIHLDGLQNGSNTYSYDGRDSSGRLLPNGVFTVRLRMNGANGSNTQTFKIVSVR